MAKAKGIMLYFDIKEPLKDFSDEERGKLVWALLEYGENRTTPQFSGSLKTAFNFIKKDIDRDIEKYIKKCDQNRDNRRKGLSTTVNDRQQSSLNKDKDKDKNKIKENNKEKNIKKESPPSKKKYAEFVSMTEEEYQRLVSEHGETAVKRMIEILDNYKGANGKKYKSDYRAILHWVVKRVNEESQNKGAKANEYTKEADKSNPFGVFTV